MTVQDLINSLEKINPNMEIVFLNAGPLTDLQYLPIVNVVKRSFVAEDLGHRVGDVLYHKELFTQVAVLKPY